MVALLLVALLAGEVTQADIEAYAAVSAEQRLRAISRAKESATPAKGAKLDRDSRRQLDAALIRLRDPKAPYFASQSLFDKPVRLTKFDSKSRGAVGGTDFNVFQVVDKRNVIVSASTYYRGQSGPYQESKRLFWLTDYDTSGLIDDAPLMLNGFFAATGTKQYDTGDASTNTVPLVEPVDLAKHRKLFTRENEIRKWKSESGDELAEGVLDGYERGVATITCTDGTAARISLSRLCKTDRSVIREWRIATGDLRPR